MPKNLAGVLEIDRHRQAATANGAAGLIERKSVQTRPSAPRRQSVRLPTLVPPQTYSTWPVTKPACTAAKKLTA